MSNFWQGPGNGKGFDSFLGDNSKMNNRTIGVLSYIKERSTQDGFVDEGLFRDEIKEYLLKNFYENPNDSLDTHFYRPALFYGFLHINRDRNLSLSIEGNLFLNNYNKKDYLECKKLIINQLDNTTYPNKATLKVKGLKLFPFRILFKLLLENKNIDTSFISKNLVHISKFSDLEGYIRTKDLSEIQTLEETSSKYLKFNTWVVNSLVDLNILTLNQKKLSIHEDILEHIEVLYNNLSFYDMFFDSTSCELNEEVAHKRVKRDFNLIQEAKKRDRYQCTVNSKHKTFISNGNNYVEGHHIIPMFQQKNYAFKLDDVENIASLCPNCHREIHSADNKIELLTRLYNLNKTYMHSNSIDLYDLYKMYSCA